MVIWMIVFTAAATISIPQEPDLEEAEHFRRFWSVPPRGAVSVFGLVIFVVFVFVVGSGVAVVVFFVHVVVAVSRRLLLLMKCGC